jgi:class 3 adenylate cyclase/tetratricopeptide (TPR) repeat protein
MRCRVCAYDNETASRSCVACGVSFASVCTRCGRDFPETARFCAWCGEPRKPDTREADVPSERKQATVLFADIAGSTARIAGMDAEGAMNFLQPIVMVMARAVHRFDGTVLRTLGDGLKAAFGVPRAREGHAVLACHAALAMRAAVAALPDAPMIRIGLHSGEVVSGKLYTGSTIEQDATGLTVHLASRIEHEAPPGEICLSRDCQTLLRAYCDTEPLGPRALKGIPDPVEIFRLIGLKPAVNSEHFRGASLTPLRGRAVELETLQRALLDTAPGSARVIGVSGPPGVGKSRLCFEFGEWCRERQIKVLEARAQVHSRATPLLPVLEALRVFFRIEPDTDAELARTRIEQTLTMLAIPVAEHLATLTDFLGCAGTEPTSRAIDPATRRMRLRDSLSRIVKAAWSQTSVIIIEDLHWLDEASQDFLETWIAAVEGTSVLMVLTFRPDWSLPSRPAWYRELALPELGLGEVGQVICDLIGDGAGLDQVVAHVAERSDGNPFFAEELILSLAQSGVLLGERGRYRLAPSGWQNPTLPTTVEAVIGARIDLLPDSEKALLQTAAIIGKEFPFEVVRAVTGLSDTAARPLLRRLRAAELIQPRQTAMGESFAFRHPLIQEVAYAMQLRSTRTSLHAAAAKAIEGQEWGRRDEFAGLLAHHYEAAGNMVAAAMHLQRSARWVGRTNSGRALADWKKIRSMMQDQPRSKENDELRALAGGQLLTFGWREGMPVEEAKTYVDEALGYAREAGNRRHEALLIAGYGRIIAASGSADEYIRLVREALAVLDAESNPEEALLLKGLLGQANMLAGLVSDTLKANSAALDLIDDERRGKAGIVLGLTVGQMVGFDVPYWLKCLQIRPLVMLGRFSEADERLARLFQTDPADAEPVHQGIPHFSAIELAWFRNDTLAAMRHANHVARFATQAGNPYWFVVASFCQGLAASTSGDFMEADGFFQQALDASRRGRAGLEFEPRILAFQADNRMRAGDPRRAAEVAAEAIGVARRKADRLAECHASLVAASACLTRSGSQDTEEAPGLLNRANALIDETGAKAYEAMMLRVRAQASDEKGLASSPPS